MSDFMFNLAYGKLYKCQTFERMEMLRRSVAAVIGREPTDNEIRDGVRVQKYLRAKQRKPEYAWRGVHLEIVPKPKLQKKR